MILKEHPYDEFLRECLQAHLEDLDTVNEKGEEPRPLFDPNDGYENISYAKLSNRLRALYYDKYKERIGDFEEAFSRCTWVPGAKGYYQIALPENNSDILMIPQYKPKKGLP